jgi:hypothetical protein
MNRISKSHWTHGCSATTLDIVNMNLMTRETATTTTAPAPETTTRPETTAGPARTGRLAAFRRAVAARRARRSELSRTIAAYPATRSAASIVLLTKSGA